MSKSQLKEGYIKIFPVWQVAYLMESLIQEKSLYLQTFDWSNWYIFSMSPMLKGQCFSVNEPKPNSYFADDIFSDISFFFGYMGRPTILMLEIYLLDNENRCPLKSPQKQHDSVSKSPLQDRTNIQTTPNNLVKRKLQSDGILYWFLVYLRLVNSLMFYIICLLPLHFGLIYHQKLDLLISCLDKENRSPVKSPRRDKNVKSPTTLCQQTKLNFSNRKLSYVNGKWILFYKNSLFGQVLLCWCLRKETISYVKHQYWYSWQNLKKSV